AVVVLKSLQTRFKQMSKIFFCEVSIGLCIGEDLGQPKAGIRKTFGRLKLFLKRLQDAVQLVEQKRRKPSLCAECAQSFPLRLGDRCALFAAIPSNQELFVVVDEPSIFRMLVDCVKLQPFAFGGGESMLLRQRIELLALFAAYRPDAGVELDES